MIEIHTNASKRWLRITSGADSALNCPSDRNSNKGRRDQWYSASERLDVFFPRKWFHQSTVWADESFFLFGTAHILQCEGLAACLKSSLSPSEDMAAHCPRYNAGVDQTNEIKHRWRLLEHGGCRLGRSHSSLLQNGNAKQEQLPILFRKAW